MLAFQLGGCGAYTPSPALFRTPLWTQTQTWPCLQIYSGCVSLILLQQRIPFGIIGLAWRSLLGLAPAYLRDLCFTTLGVPGRRALRSTEQGFQVKSSICLLCKCQREDRLHTNHSCHRRKYDLQRRYLK